MAGRTVVKDVDRGAKRLLAELSKAGTAITVGIHEAEGAAQEKDTKRTVIDVATWNEFGTTKIPERSFIRAWFDLYVKQNTSLLQKMARSVVLGRYTAEQMLGQLGSLFKAQVQQRISQGIPPANADSTIARKGSSTPLINHGQLRSSVQYQVVRAS